jgi:hypothetical protein
MMVFSLFSASTEIPPGSASPSRADVMWSMPQRVFENIATRTALTRNYGWHKCIITYTHLILIRQACFQNWQSSDMHTDRVKILADFIKGWGLGGMSLATVANPINLQVPEKVSCSW